MLERILPSRPSKVSRRAAEIEGADRIQATLQRVRGMSAHAPVGGALAELRRLRATGAMSDVDYAYGVADRLSGR